MTRHFDLVSHWTVCAPRDAVWDALVHTEDWPRWWPEVQSAQLVRSGRGDGVGRVVRITWRTRLPYRLSLDVQCLEVLAQQRLRGQAQGALRGEGIWLLQAEGELTLVTYLWRVQLNTAWMRLLCPLLAPLFRWNHAQLMASGGAGLARYLSRQGAALAWR